MVVRVDLGAGEQYPNPRPICRLSSGTADTRDAPGRGQSMGIYRSSLGPHRNHPGNPCHHRTPTAGGYSVRCGTGNWRPRRCDRWLSAREERKRQCHPRPRSPTNCQGADQRETALGNTRQPRVPEFLPGQELGTWVALRVVGCSLLIKEIP